MSPLHLLIICSIIIGDAMLVLIIMPFLPEQCRIIWGVKEEYVGTASGIVLGAVAFSSFFSSFYLGRLSDIYGRKPILCCGLFSSCVSLALYGFSTNVYWAFASLFIPGLFNSNVSIARAVCSDITLPGNDRAVAMGYINACFAFSRFVSSSIGGFMVIKFENIPFLDKNPYLFPCLVGSLFNALCFILVLFCFSETLPYSVLVVDEELPKETDSLLRKKEYHAKPKLSECLDEFKKDSQAIWLLICFAIGSFSNAGIMVALSLIFSLDTKNGGMGFDVKESGIVYAWMALSGFLFQILFYKKSIEKFGLYDTCWASYAILIFTCLSIPFCSPLGKVGIWISILPLLTTTATLLSFSSATLTAMQSNNTKNDRQGFVMGITGSLGSLMRAFGPFVIGTSFSLVFPFAAFAIISLDYFACLLILRGKIARAE